MSCFRYLVLAHSVRPKSFSRGQYLARRGGGLLLTVRRKCPEERGFRCALLPLSGDAMR